MATGAASQFYYNAAGNIQNRTVNGTVETYGYDTSETYGYDPNHLYAVNSVRSGGSTIYSASYDADGNMLSRNGYQITWTPANLPASIASAQGSSTFSYDPDHARYYQSAAFSSVTTDTTYVGGLFEVVSSSTGTTEYRHNIVVGGQVIAVHTIDGNGSASTDYLHYDHLGSVDAITDDQGSVIQAMSFDAFGLRRDASNWNYDLSQNQIATLKNYTDRGYTDQEQLDNLSLVDLNGRVYDPTVGRMISADPTVPDALFSQAFNRYSYVYNSPLEYTDPSGLTSCPPTQRHCPTSSDGSGDSGTNTETGSHIPGVNTGASCSGDCTGAGTGNWGPMGPGSGNSSDNGSTGDPPGESGGDGPGNDNHNSSSASQLLAACQASGNCQQAQLGSIQVNGTSQSVLFPGTDPFSSWQTLLNDTSITFNSWQDFIKNTPPGYYRLGIRGLEIGKTNLLLPILFANEENLLMNMALSAADPWASWFWGSNPNLFGPNDGLFHADWFWLSPNNNGQLQIQSEGFFNGPTNGILEPDLTPSGNNLPINDFEFSPLIPQSEVNRNQQGFGPGTYNIILNNCQSYIICTLGPGG